MISQAGLVDEIARDECLGFEQTMKNFVANEEYFNAWMVRTIQHRLYKPSSDHHGLFYRHGTPK